MKGSLTSTVIESPQRKFLNIVACFSVRSENMAIPSFLYSWPRRINICSSCNIERLENSKPLSFKEERICEHGVFEAPSSETKCEDGSLLSHQVNNASSKIKRYERDFLLSLQYSPLSTMRPKDLLPWHLFRDRLQSQGLNLVPADVSGKETTCHTSDSNWSTPQNRFFLNSAGYSQAVSSKKTIHICFNEEIELRTCQNAWKPRWKPGTGDEDEGFGTRQILKKVTGLLNKMSPENFDKLVLQIMELDIDSEERLTGVVDILFEKAVSESCYIDLYAKLCSKLSTIEVCTTVCNKLVSFRKLLLVNCQRLFEKSLKPEVLASGHASEDSDEYYKQKKFKRRSLGNIRLIGELFKKHLIIKDIVNTCIYLLLREGSDDCLELLCVLFATVGKELDSSDRKAVDDYFQDFKTLALDRSRSSRIKFMFQDLIDLRTREWLPKGDNIEVGDEDNDYNV